jgi:3-oxoacyl-[acyl-carrier protein] reductase
MEPDMNVEKQSRLNVHSKMSFCGKVALVTGSSRGIGRAIAIELAKNGIFVAVNYLENDKLAEEVVEDIRNFGGHAIKIKADVRIFKEVRSMVEEVMKSFGRIDILVNNAGITRDRTVLKMSWDEWKDVIETNLDGVFNTTKAALNHMLKQGCGKIINISSVIGLTGNFGQANYAASKAGVISFTKSLARELGKEGITVNAVAPGFIQTDMLMKVSEDIRAQILDRISLRRFGRPEEVAKLVSFLVMNGVYITKRREVERSSAECFC